MNKNDLIASIAESAKISKKAAAQSLDGMLATLFAAIKEGKRVTLAGFGTFSIVERAPRTGRNPQTGETVPIPPRRVVKFRPGRELSRKIQ
ncbi:MAG: HU family DNA-binding protein [Desulfobulbus sp.]|jgi:DNA-binding protein HU-beta|uniref:HU family DNA-binding protein n=1 Tax=Desulfobulbus sp. TaxID=895 RepID=UPI00284FD755|nr:HU family DNA-binding protein [Desulfobulbus sp.]MDR2550618.1 HU family DNA-binding protein [Desulfobulbus sp.]